VVFSFTVNLILVLVLLLAIGPLFQAKNQILEPLLTNLDQAFQGLGETKIDTTVYVEESIPISFTLPLSQPLGISFDLPINQSTVVVLNEPVPLNAPARFTLPSAGGVINGSVYLELPRGMRLPVQLTMNVPVQTVIPVNLDVPVGEEVPVEMAIPVTIELGEAGLDPAVQRLRGVFSPLRDSLEKLPDGIDEILP
jgi:hypothetical protein